MRNKKGQFIKTHGLTDTRFYGIYGGIKSRCNNPNRVKYASYGNRGIKCLWKSFDEFKNDMYRSYLEHVEKFGEFETTIERKNNDGNYCKKNCSWATHSEQSRNTKRNRLVTYKGQTKCLTDWAQEINIEVRTLWYRLDASWPIEKAFTLKPVLGRNQSSK